MRIDVQNEKVPPVIFDIQLRSLKLAAIEQSRLKIGCSLLSEMGEAYGIKVLPEVIEGDFASVQVAWSVFHKHQVSSA